MELTNGTIGTARETRHGQMIDGRLVVVVVLFAKPRSGPLERGRSSLGPVFRGAFRQIRGEAFARNHTGGVIDLRRRHVGIVDWAGEDRFVRDG